MTRSTLIVAVAASMLVTGPSVNATGGDDRSRLPVRLGQLVTPGAEVLVEKGDHLWSISVDQLHSHATTAEISSLWRQVVAANIDRLRSGDPDLIYPGEWVLVPAPPTDSP